MTLADLANLNREILAEAEAKAAASAAKVGGRPAAERESATLPPSGIIGNVQGSDGGEGVASSAAPEAPAVRMFANTRNAAVGSLRLLSSWGSVSSPSSASAEGGGSGTDGATSISRRRLSFFAYSLLDGATGAPLAGGQVRTPTPCALGSRLPDRGPLLQH